MTGYENILRIIEKRIQSLPEDRRSRIEKDDVLGLVEETLDLIRSGVLDEEKAFYTILGIAWDYMIPLTPRDVRAIAETLGIPMR